MGGVFGISCDYKEGCFKSLVDGIFAIQNRGESHCGLTTVNKIVKKPLTLDGLLLDSLTDEDCKKFSSGNLGLGNTDPLVRQPFGFDTKIGKFAISYSGKILNRRSLINQLKKRGHSFRLKHTDVEVVAKLIAEGDDFVDGIEKMAEQVKGAYSLGILTTDGLYAFKSPIGIEPLILGSNDNIRAFSSETVSLKGIGLRRVSYRDINPGEIVFVDDKIETVKQLEGKKATCAFEWGYWARIDSIFEGISVKSVREKCGKALATYDIEDGLRADVVIPVRDSGTGYAIGYHHGSKVPYDEGLFKNWYVTRTYGQPTQIKRSTMAGRKQSYLRDVVDGKIVVVADDSIRRGTTFKEDLIPKLRTAGAKEIHIRIGSPENKYSCMHSVFPRVRGELLAEKGDLEIQRKFLGVDSLKYICLDDYVKSIGLPENELCLGCWTGKYPTD